MILVDQPGPYRLRREVRPADCHVATRRGLHPAHRFRVELSLDPGPRSGRLLQFPRVNDLVGAGPDRREVLDDGRLVGQLRRLLPICEHLVHAAAEQVGPDRPFEVVDEGVHLFVGHGPVEVALAVGHIAVERHDRCIDQLCD